MRSGRNRIWFLFYVIGLLLLLLWLLFSTYAITKIVNGDSIKEVVFEDIRDSNEKDIIYFSTQGEVDFISYDGGMFDRLSITGWAFCETVEDNSHRKVSYLLNSENKCYELIPDIIQRTDIPISHPDQKVKSSYVGTLGKFSLLNIEDGIYDLYICCWENETNYGFSDMYYQLEKEGDTVQIYPWRGHRVENLVEVTQIEEPVGYLDGIDTEGEYIKIQDWEFVEGKNSDAQKVLIEFMDEMGMRMQYTTKSMKRKDVADAYNSELYLYSGILTRIPISYFTDGKYTVKILVENEGEVWQSQKYKMQIKEGVASKVD